MNILIILKLNLIDMIVLRLLIQMMYLLWWKFGIMKMKRFRDGRLSWWVIIAWKRRMKQKQRRMEIGCSLRKERKRKVGIIGWILILIYSFRPRLFWLNLWLPVVGKGRKRNGSRVRGIVSGFSPYVCEWVCVSVSVAVWVWLYECINTWVY